MPRREDLDDDQLAIVKEMLRSYVRQMGMCEETGLNEDELVETQLSMLEAGLIEIVGGPTDEEGNFQFAIVPTAKPTAAVEGGR